MTNFPAEYILFAKTCSYCGGSAQIQVSNNFYPTPTAGNINTSSSSHAVTCPSCSHGVHFIRFSPEDFMRIIAEEIMNRLLLGPDRSRWYDAVHQEIEKRIKDVELQIMSTEAMKREKHPLDLDVLGGDLTGPATRLEPGDRVRFRGAAGYTIPGSNPPAMLNHGDSGHVVQVRTYTTQNGVTGVNVFASINGYPSAAFPPSLLEKIS